MRVLLFAAYAAASEATPAAATADSAGKPGTPGVGRLSKIPLATVAAAIKLPGRAAAERNVTVSPEHRAALPDCAAFDACVGSSADMQACCAETLANETRTCAICARAACTLRVDYCLAETERFDSDLYCKSCDALAVVEKRILTSSKSWNTGRGRGAFNSNVRGSGRGSGRGNGRGNGRGHPRAPWASKQKVPPKKGPFGGGPGKKGPGKFPPKMSPEKAAAQKKQREQADFQSAMKKAAKRMET